MYRFVPSICRGRRPGANVVQALRRYGTPVTPALLEDEGGVDARAVGLLPCWVCQNATTRSIAEFLSFRRLPSESIDSTLVRFDIFRTRAQNRAGFAINWTGLSWLLLQAIHVPAEIWDRLLAPLNGQLPQHEHELHELMERLRRVFHLREGRMHGNHTPGATGDNGAFFTEHQSHDTANGYFPAFDDNQSPSNTYATGSAPVPSDPWALQRLSRMPISPQVGRTGRELVLKHTIRTTMKCVPHVVLVPTFKMNAALTPAPIMSPMMDPLPKP